MRIPGIVSVSLLLVCVAGQTASADEPSAAVARIRKDADALRPTVTSPLAGRFLEKAAALPDIAPRKLHRDASRTHYYTEAEAQKLPAAEQEALEMMELDAGFYYNTKYGSPLAYVRPLDLLAGAGLNDLKRKKVLDFGYGSIGHLKLMAEMGARVVGVEVDPMLRALYSFPGDQGKVTLLHGNFPGEQEIRSRVSDGYDLFISKNVLKNGYIHPAREVDPKRLVHLGVSDEAFVDAVSTLLNPGGFAMIYNLHPPESPPDQPYFPWADGRCPFARNLWEAAGFEILQFDKDDGPAARAMAHALGWDQGEGGMNLEKDLFATWTLVRKGAAPRR